MNVKRIIDIINNDDKFNLKSNLDYIDLVNIFIRLDIICPNENHWFNMWEDLRKHSLDKECLPIAYVSTSWHYTTDKEKRKRFFEHLQFAEEKNVLEKVIDYLFNLGIDDFNTELNLYF
ncbi:MAG: hypothetical protein ACNI28_11680 [Arcobacter sp.]|uniref:hypothetical protein n=1 Tax=Arcobacter sp. TaxID=1872629 RepID=UPI003AFF8B7B